MLHCTMYETSMKIAISDPNFDRDLARLTTTVPKRDRRYDGHRRIWIIQNPERYKVLPEIKAAIEDRQRQPLLF